MLRRVVNFAAGSLDDVIAGRMIHRSMSASAATATLGHAERMRLMSMYVVDYEKDAHYADVGAEGAFFVRPQSIAPRLARVRLLAGGDVFDATWPSEYEIFSAGLADRYNAVAENRTAAARLFLHAGDPRPMIVLIHGYRGGPYGLEERVFPVSAFYARGLDVALAVLPFHGVRGDGRPRFPSSDPRFTIEGFRHAAFDLMGLVGDRLALGAPAVGVMGMSLGGYTTTLLATLDPRLRFAIPMMPLASIADLARNGGRLVGTREEQVLQHAMLERMHRVVSPIARARRIPEDGGLVLAFEGDRITPLEQARKIAAHLAAPLEIFAGGHILQADRGNAFRAALRHLGRVGVLSPRRGD